MAGLERSVLFYWLAGKTGMTLLPLYFYMQSKPGEHNSHTPLTGLSIITTKPGLKKKNSKKQLMFSE